MKKIKADTTLQDKLKRASDLETFIAIAKESGFVISTEDLKKSQVEVSDKELEGVAGGGGVCWILDLSIGVLVSAGEAC